MKQLHTVLFTIFLFVTIHVYAQPGALDLSFGNHGKVISLPSNDSIVSCYHGVLQPDGKIICTGTIWKTQFSQIDCEMLVVRYNPDGSIDPTFGNGGFVKKDFYHSGDNGNVSVLQPDGKIITAGSATVGNEVDLALVRMLPNGTTDSTFGVNGLVTTDVHQFPNTVSSMYLQPDGKIVISGNVSNPDGPIGGYALVRYHPNGVIDSTFGVNGIVTSDGVLNGFAVAAQPLPNGKILAVGRDREDFDDDMAFFLHNADGSFDTTFGTGGKLAFPLGVNTFDYAQNLVVQPDNKVVILGETYPSSFSGTAYYYISRLKEDLTPDSTFGINGVTLIQKGDVPDQLNSIVLQPNGKMNLSGCSYAGPIPLLIVKQLNANGSIDSTFGINGHVSTTFNLNQQCGYGLVYDSSNNTIVAVGTGFKNKTSIIMARYLLGDDMGVGTIDAHPAVEQVFINPNPVKANNTLRFSLQKPAQVNIRLLDLQGRVVQQYCDHQAFEAGEHVMNINIDPALPGGMWLLSVQTDNGATTIKLVK